MPVYEIFITLHIFREGSLGRLASMSWLSQSARPFAG